MKVLGLDCAGFACSVAVLVDGAVLAERSETMERGQAEALLPMIGAALDTARLEARALERIAVTLGPGSFTGLRTGLAAARGLALAWDIPVTGVTSFEAAAAAVADSAAREPLLIALESKRAELYLQIFAEDGAGEPALVPRAAWSVVAPAGAFRVAGDGGERFAEGLGRDGPILVRPRESLAVSAARLAGQRPASALPPEPLYLRAPDVSFPSRREKSAP